MTEPSRPAALAEQQGTVNDLAFTWLEAGDPDAPLALCLHGFPDTAHGWRDLLPLLADAGYHAVAPFAHGYAPTAVPADGSSAISAWIADATAFHEQLGHDRPGVLIGHDWGAMTTYGAAAFAPARWSRIVAASVPPTTVMATKMLDFDQVRRFWYQYVFLQPTAEMIVANNDFEFLEGLWREWSPGFDPTSEIGAVKDALREPAHLTAGLSTYRSIYDFSLQPPEFAAEAAAILAPPPQPTLYLHGADDGCIDASIVDAVLAALPEGSRSEVVPDAGHFLQYEQPELVNRLILDFVGDAGSRS